eukprot:GHVS01105981.1.p3 GENE.GHVS01105981.1~~GHVS01105981.1.p3  ORF type:complete len:136 (-),score=21.95 GHVS01105981.1:175-582(-)
MSTGNATPPRQSGGGSPGPGGGPNTSTGNGGSPVPGGQNTGAGNGGSSGPGGGQNTSTGNGGSPVPGGGQPNGGRPGSTPGTKGKLVKDNSSAFSLLRIHSASSTNVLSDFFSLLCSAASLLAIGSLVLPSVVSV